METRIHLTAKEERLRMPTTRIITEVSLDVKYGGYYTAARRYESYFRVVETTAKMLKSLKTIRLFLIF